LNDIDSQFTTSETAAF